jgi:type IV pilus assembly protein PilB
MLKHAVEGKASDIHIEPTKKELKIRFRIDGILQTSLLLPLNVHPAVIARIKILSSLKIDETRMPQDGRFSTKVGNKDIDFRVSTFPTTLGEKAVLRVLDASEGVKSFEDLGLERRNYEALMKAVKKPFGMILATGPTGSGKTTTLYSVLDLLNQEGVNIITLEDPVEYFVGGISQSQIRPEIGYTFARGLRHILRQDPDIIMVGEIRDEETAALATHAALTGHIVLSTLHTNNTLGVAPRLIDLGVAPFLIPSALSLSIAQRLVRTLCPHCKKKVKPSAEVEKIIMEEIEKLPEQIKKEIKIPDPIMVYEAQGCKKCGNKGYTGRIALFELLETTRQLGEIILKDPTETKIEQEAVRQGMITMKQDGILKVLDGITSLEEVLRAAEI